MSQLRVIRQASDRFGGTYGDLWIDNHRACYTLEDQIRELEGVPVSSWKIKGETAIPAGSYTMIFSKSVRFGIILPEILEVPGFSGIRIHTGNVIEDTEGCLLVGLTHAREGARPWLGRSRDAYKLTIGRLDQTIAHRILVENP